MISFTHKGWFGICPVYLAGIETGAPIVEPRNVLFAPLMFVSEAWYAFKFTVFTAMDSAFEPVWPIVITGEVKHERK